MASSQLETLTAAINSLLQLQLQREQSNEASAGLPSKSIDVYNQISTRIEKYVFASGDITRPFSKWLLRHKYTLVSESESLPPEMRTRLLLDNLG